MNGFAIIGILGKMRMNKCRFILIVVMVVFLFIAYNYSVGINHRSIVIYTGYTKTLKLSGFNRKCVWKTENKNVADVDNGKIIAISEGNTVISAKTRFGEYSCAVEVKKALSFQCDENIEREKNWILKQQLETGAFCNCYDEKTTLDINPYFASITADALINCADKEDKTVETAVKKYIEWHFEHINKENDYNGIEGTIYDYKVLRNGENLEERSTYTYDSADSYASVFLTLLWDYYKKTGDKSVICENKDMVDKIVNVIFQLQDELYTIAKPDYNVIYLMDNSEVYAGISSAYNIYKNVVDDEKTKKRIRDMKESYEDKFENDWFDGEHFRISLGTDKYFSRQFYPDAIAQLFPVIYDISDDSNSKKIYRDFCKNWNWNRLDYYTSGETKFFWGEVFYCGVIMGDMEKAWEYMQYYVRYSDKREYPMYICDAAWVMMGNMEMYKYYKAIELECSDDA